MKFSVLLSVFCSICISNSAFASNAWPKGDIKVGSLQGSGTYSYGTQPGNVKPLASGISLSEGVKIETQPNSQAVLIFSNGSTMTLKEKTEFHVDQYKRTEPINPIKSLAALKKEPTKSIVKLRVEKGDAIGTVKTLHQASSYTVKTPMGSAGIRGTVYRTNVAGGRVSVLEGRVDITLPNGNTIVINPGQAVSVQFDNNGGVQSSEKGNASSEDTQTMQNSAEQASENIKQADNQGFAKQGSSDGENADEKGDKKEVADANAPSNKGEDKGASTARESDQKRILATKGTNIQTIRSLTGAGALNLLQAVEGSALTPAQIELFGQLSLTEQTRLNNLYNATIKSLILNTADLNFVKALLRLSPALSNAELAGILTKPNTAAFAKFKALTRASALNGNNALLHNLFVLGGGSINEALADAGKLANTLLTDVTINGAINPNRVYNYDSLFSSGYNKALVRLLASESNNGTIAKSINAIIPGTFGKSSNIGTVLTSAGKNTDLLISGRKISSVSKLTNLALTPNDGSAFLGKTVTLASGSTINVTSKLGTAAVPSTDKGEAFVIGAFDDLKIQGSVTFQNDNTVNNNALVLGAADELTIASGSTITNQGSTLAIGANKSMSLVNVSLNTKGTLLVGTLNDLTIQNSTMTVGNGGNHEQIYLFAGNKLSVNGLSFGSSPSPSSIYMEAITVDLQNVTFPGSSNVSLVSRDGPISGKYPNFGSSVVGRVNFISNVKVDANLINSQSAFDSHATKIKIRKF